MKPIVAIPATLALVYRAYSRKSLTPVGIFAAAITGALHSAHPSPAPFAFLVVFFLGGTRVTKIKHDIKARLTVSSMGGGSGAEGPRTHVQVFANSGFASLLVLLDLWRLWQGGEACFGLGGKGSLFLLGITANYAAVAADTFSSELGILAKSSPRLITSLTLRKVPRGTNGGVTLEGLAAGALGAFMIAATSIAFLPFCPTGWDWERKSYWVLVVVLGGVFGSILDSILGGLLQSTVVDKRSGKVVEGIGGSKVLVHPSSATASPHGDISVRRGSQLHTAEDIVNTIMPQQAKIVHEPPTLSIAGKDGDEHESRKVISGFSGILDNNDVNFLMAAMTSGLAMFVGSYLTSV